MKRTTKWIIGCVIVFAAIFVCVLCIGRINSRSPDAKSEHLEEANTTDITNYPSTEETIKPTPNPVEWYMSGFSEKWYVNEETVVNLSNDPQNKNITLVYIITWESDNESKTYETEEIEAGDFVPWSPAKYLPKGENKVTIRELPTYHYEGERIEFPYADQIITVNVE